MAETVAQIRRRRKYGKPLCVRCGKAPRLEAGPIYLCGECAIAPATYEEMTLTEHRSDQRLTLMREHGWAGGWAAKVPADV